MEGDTDVFVFGRGIGGFCRCFLGCVGRCRDGRGGCSFAGRGRTRLGLRGEETSGGGLWGRRGEGCRAGFCGGGRRGADLGGKVAVWGAEVLDGGLCLRHDGG